MADVVGLENCLQTPVFSVAGMLRHNSVVLQTSSSSWSWGSGLYNDDGGSRSGHSATSGSCWNIVISLHGSYPVGVTEPTGSSPACFTRLLLVECRSRCFGVALSRSPRRVTDVSPIKRPVRARCAGCLNNGTTTTASSLAWCSCQASNERTVAITV